MTKLGSLEEAVGDAGDEAEDFVTACRENEIALLEGIVDIARFARKRAERMDFEMLRDGEAFAQVEGLLRGHRDHHVGGFQQFHMAFQIGGSGFVADIDADFAQRHPGIERDEGAVAGVGRDAGGADAHGAVDTALTQFTREQMLGHHAARRIGGADQEDRGARGVFSTRSRVRTRVLISHWLSIFS